MSVCQQADRVPCVPGVCGGQKEVLVLLELNLDHCDPGQKEVLDLLELNLDHCEQPYEF